MQDFSSFLQIKPPKVPLLSPGTLNFAKLNPIPRRFRPSRSRGGHQKKRSTANFTTNAWFVFGSNEATALNTSFNPMHSIRALRRRSWRILDIQYVILAALIIFSLAISPSAPIIKTLALCATVLVLLMPATNQFFLPSLSIWTYLLYFFCSRFIDAKYRPHIWVRVLPALENVLYGANLSNILSAHTHAVLDILAWLPYGIGHFANPAICSILIWTFGAPKTLPVFAKAFGWLNVLGVTLQLVFPCTPPWYENEHGLAPAAYGMQGSPAGLARVDKIFGVDMYTTNFTTAPLPFGAFPSLHAADAVLEALFMIYCFPRFRAFFISYVAWIWWATMYLNHHYAVDLVGGSLISAAIFYTAKTRYLPKQQSDKATRFEYTYVEIGEQKKVVDEEYGDFYSLGLMHRQRSADSDEWTVGSTSSCSTLSTSGSGTLSPAPSDEGHPQGVFSVEMTPHGHMWDGGVPPHDGDLSEVVVIR
ncbi:Aureobasidin resistance protein Aur1 [Verticillium nonalfalfae]|uniref:Aureobasidin resistance protein Aur1 n=1 Tax=Verticillium nonalfalfae TaxID=1051616 RepID=A0A3M9YKC6_9PEZI|nr:Aureobasidin resistance protein Aur1 [Verticillium nonalfalfae]RNJ60412.1 Aureobasidin resistance protein Aur1 [Verticillium nonalfalfae]